MSPSVPDNWLTRLKGEIQEHILTPGGISVPGLLREIFDLTSSLPPPHTIAPESPNLPYPILRILWRLAELCIRAAIAAQLRPIATIAPTITRSVRKKRKGRKS